MLNLELNLNGSFITLFRIKVNFDIQLALIAKKPLKKDLVDYLKPPGFGYFRLARFFLKKATDNIF